MVGVDVREADQIAFLDVCTSFRQEYSRFPDRMGRNKPFEFHFQNGTFERVDAEVLHTMVRHYRPQKIIEIGAGYGTLVTAAACIANQREHQLGCEFIAIEPSPNDLFKNTIPGLTRLVNTPLQQIGLDLFSALEPNDILFIDSSSHILKIGSDVQYEYLEILPRLKPGVIVHIHDIFLPGEYPRDWAVQEHIFWNEQYLLQAFLSFNEAFEVLWAGCFMHRKHPEMLIEAFPGYDPSRSLPGSFWMRRV
jgi:predicted O-methyltransferase YrrM